MKKLPPTLPPWEDGPAPESLRGLLDAGRHPEGEGLEGYDFDGGLSRHLAHVRAGTPLPEWARELMGPGGTGGGGAASGGAAAGGAAAGSGLKLLPFILVPLVSAGLVAAVMLTSPEVGRDTGLRDVPAAKPVPASPEPAPAMPPAAEPPAVALAPVSDAREPSVGAVQPSVVEPSADTQPSEAVLRSEQALRTIRRAADAQHAGKPVTSSQAKALRADREQGIDPDGVIELPAGPRRTAQAQAAQPEAAPAPVQAQAQADEQQQPAPAKVVDDSRLEREMGMLAMAQRVLTSDPERALRLARQGEQEFAGSMFTQERQQVLLLALIELGRVDEARRLAKPYLQRYPNGPFGDRVRRALANATTTVR